MGGDIHAGELIHKVFGALIILELRDIWRSNLLFADRVPVNGVEPRVLFDRVNAGVPEPRLRRLIE